jgi:hypothetical protein
LGNRAAAGASDIPDFQRPLAGICELELAAILRPQSDLPQIANRLLKTNLRQNILCAGQGRGKDQADQDNSRE